jgi:hypothetical protein
MMLRPRKTDHDEYLGLEIKMEWKELFQSKDRNFIFNFFPMLNQEEITLQSHRRFEDSRTELIELMAESSYLFAFVNEAETMGILRLNKEARAKYHISRSEARYISRLLGSDSLGIFKFKPGHGYLYSGTPFLSVIYNGQPI